MSDDLNKQIILLEKLLKKEDNKYCADCRRKSPSWASITAGVYLCIKCAGFHRELGVHITKVKSVNLDKWPKGVADKFTKITNAIANSYWEHKLKDEEFERLRNDDIRLFDFVKDKYERRRWAPKGKDPMTLIYEGQEPEVVQKKEEKDEEKEIHRNKNSVKKPLVSFVDVNKNENVNMGTFNSGPGKHTHLSQSISNNMSLIDLSTNIEVKHSSKSNNDIENLIFNNNNNLFENNNNLVTKPPQSGFSFINKNNSNQTVNNDNTNPIQSNSNNNISSSLLDLNSHESQKSNQLKSLTDSITNVYNNPPVNMTHDSRGNKQGQNYIQLNQPNINISNTFYNVGLGYNQNPNVNGNQIYNNNLQNNMLNNVPLMNPYRQMNQIPNSNLNMNMNMYPMNNQMIPNNQTINTNSFYDLNLSSQNNQSSFDSYNQNLNYPQVNFNSNSINKKKEEDPFKGLVSFK